MPRDQYHQCYIIGSTCINMAFKNYNTLLLYIKHTHTPCHVSASLVG